MSDLLNETPIQTARRLIANEEILVSAQAWRKLTGVLADDAERFARLKAALPIPEDIRQMIVSIWTAEQVDEVLDARQQLLDEMSARELIASGNAVAVRAWLSKLYDGVHL